MLLKDKVTIVTGASGGIGLGIAAVFAEEGAKVVCVARREKEGQATAAALCEKGGEASFVRCDVSQGDQVDAMVQAVLDRYGRIDSLVNNAGVNFVKPFEELTTEEWDRVIGVDLRGTFLCTKACIDPFLRQGSGNVVNIATVHTASCLPGAAPYDAAKWGMVGLTKSLAVEFASRNIRFNCLSPGLIDTQIWGDIRDAAEDLDACEAHWWSNIPMGRVGTCREMGQAAVFLASDKASYITGANLFADGGMTSLLVSKEGYKSKALEGK
ncbi:MAG: SDR family NAD(P)-dependent oxidoreductase [Candidatus Latescibacterota bacterium]